MERPGESLTMARGATPGARLDHKALRLAVHGWRLGNPLVYKFGARDLCGVARELASTGVASGACIVDDVPGADVAQVALILRPAEPRALLGMAAACAVAEVMEGALGRACIVTWPWDVALRGDRALSRLCRVSVEVDDTQDAAFVRLRFALGRVLAARRAASAAGAEPSPLFARTDWREVLLARALHALDIRLSALLATEREPESAPESEALRQEWRRRLVAPYRVVVFRRDGGRTAGVVERDAPDGGLTVRDANGAAHGVALTEVAASGGSGWTAHTRR